MELGDLAKLMASGAGSAINTGLLLAIMWFIRRLIIRVDKIDKIDILEVQVRAMVHEMKDLGKLRERVAVLEAIRPLRKGIRNES